MQPVQDLTIDTTASSTQYQFMLEDADPDELSQWAPQLVAKLRRCRSLKTSPTICRPDGLSDYVNVDRDTAGQARHHAGHRR